LDEECDTTEVELIKPPSPEHRRLDSDETTEQKKTDRICRRIREIDAQYGTTPNNPRVAESIAQLGTHYDSIERIIETVYSLQLEEIAQEQKAQAAELIRELKWLKGDFSSAS
jgi:hypothetical protein